MLPEERVEHLKKIQSAYSKCKEYSDDKVQLAMQTYEMVRTKNSETCKYIHNLDWGWWQTWGAPAASVCLFPGAFAFNILLKQSKILVSSLLFLLLSSPPKEKKASPVFLSLVPSSLLYWLKAGDCFIRSTHLLSNNDSIFTPPTPLSPTNSFRAGLDHKQRFLGQL